MVKIYNLVGNNFILNPVKTIFENRGINPTDAEWYLTPTRFEHDYEQINNIKEGVDMLIYHVEKGNHIHVQIDLDCDGIMSSAMLIQYIRKTFETTNVTWSNHVNKKHGIDLTLVPDSAKLLIVPDAGTSDYEEHCKLKNKGIDVLVIDHHEATRYSNDALVINNQLDNYPNKQLSGAGMTYKFLQAMDDKLDICNHEEYADLCAFGMLGDAMKLSNKETFWMINDGFKNIKNDFLIELIRENVEEGVRLTPKIVSFKCLPKLNSLLRVGTKEELDDVFKAFTGHKEITINNRLRSADKTETWARRMVRTCNNTYARQRRLREKIMEELKETIKNKGLDKNKFIAIEVKGDYPTNMSGYVAISLVKEYQKPCIVLRENDLGMLVGSMRGLDSFMGDTKHFLNSLQLFEVAEGHPNACGLEIRRENFNVLNETINNRLKHYENSNLLQVDFVMKHKSMTKNFIEDMDRYSILWGKGIEEPVYVVDVEVKAENIDTIGKNKSVMKFELNGVEYVQFSICDDIRDYIGGDKTLIMDVVGSTSINTWLGKSKPQFNIEKIKIKEVKESNGFTFDF